MPKFKTATFVEHNDAGARLELKVDIQISADGVFYANLPDTYRSAFLTAPGFKPLSRAPGTFRLEAVTYDKLHNEIITGLRAYLKPEVEEVAVIRYNIESHVSFAETSDGRVVPNAGYPDAQWRKERGQFGSHHAASPAKGGYSLTIGARALTRRTIRYGDSCTVKYETYYKGESHLGHDNPAQLLNSWVSYQLPENCKEIPYSDEAALFFHRLLLGMATLSRQIQDSTFDQTALLALIAKQDNALMLAGPASN